MDPSSETYAQFSQEARDKVISQYLSGLLAIAFSNDEVDPGVSEPYRQAGCWVVGEKRIRQLARSIDVI